MAVFTYKATEPGSGAQSGTITADTPRQARENTKDLGRPLGTKHGKSKPQFGLIETRLFPPKRAVIIEQLIGNRTGNVDAGILKHRYEVVGGMAENAVLRINEADAPHPLQQTPRIR